MTDKVLSDTEIFHLPKSTIDQIGDVLDKAVSPLQAFFAVTRILVNESITKSKQKGQNNDS